ncbi:MAG TPA: hypothetical protein VMW70_06000 [Burkholderiales bacterium]|nr:hypothetical protein [Burkholderiales bacterium]
MASNSDHSFPAGEQWEAVLARAWRPAWSIRSRKGCLAPFVAWWRQRRGAGGGDSDA